MVVVFPVIPFLIGLFVVWNFWAVVVGVGIFIGGWLLLKLLSYVLDTISTLPGKLPDLSEVVFGVVVGLGIVTLLVLAVACIVK